MDFIEDFTDSTSSADFAARGDKWLAGISPFGVDYAAAAAIGVAGGLLSTTSATSNSITFTQKTVVLAADIDLVPSMPVVMAETATPTNYIYGVVDSYVPGTKTLTFTPWVLGGSGSSITAWTVSAIASGLAVIGEPQSEIWVTGGASGAGSTNTRIRRFATVRINTGSDMTFTASSTNGDSITINTTGLYMIECADAHGAATDMYYGVTLNESALFTTDFSSVTNTMRLLTCRSSNSIFSDGTQGGAILARLSATDVLRLHISGASLSADVDVMLHVTKMGS